MGTQFAVTTNSEIDGRQHKSGHQFTAEVAEPVTNAAGRVVIPAGSQVTLQVVEIKPSEHQGGEGTLVVRTVDVTVNGETYPVAANVTGLQMDLRGRGVTAGDAGKVAAGAAAGAILGKIIGRKASGAVIGGVVGAAVGTAIAVKTADRDVVVPAGSQMTLELREEFTRTVD